MLTYTAIALTLILYHYVQHAVLCYSGDPLFLYYEIDVFRLLSRNFLEQLDKKFKSRWVPPVVLTAVSFIPIEFISWHALDPSGILHSFIGFLCLIAAWKAVTVDIDLATGEEYFKERAIMVLALIGTFLYPGFLILFLFTGIHFLRSWFNHQYMLLRILLIFAAYLAAVTLLQTLLLLTSVGPQPISTAAPLFLFLLVMATHYFIPGIAKLKLGDHWYSWAVENKLHYLVMNAYLFGWLRQCSMKSRVRLIHFIQKFESPLQFGNLIFECGWVLSCFNANLTMGLCLMGILFHLSVVILTGIFFWESLLINAAMFAVILSLPLETSHELFNVPDGFFFASILILFHLRYRLWNTPDLSWWDSPFFACVRFYVEGKSGKRYQLHNDFMSPHDRLYGLNWQLSFYHDHKLIHQHLGELKKPQSYDLRNAIIASQGDIQVLEALKDKYGVSMHNASYEKTHDNHLYLFFRHFNEGKPRRICPSWLKAPGQLFFYWGELESFRGQESVSKVIITYREEFFDGKEVKVVRENLIKEINLTS